MHDFLVEISPLLQAALVAVLTVVLPLGLRYLHAWLVLKQAEIEQGIPEYQLYFAKDLIRELVQAAEQQGVNGYLEEVGQSKLDYVLNLAQSELRAQGIDFDLAMLRALVEAAVKREFGKTETPAAG